MVFLPLDHPTMERPCQVCVSHQLTSDGYLNKTWGVKGRPINEAFHRFILRAHLGLAELPKGIEVDHICGNRACCEPSHLRTIEGSDHRSLSNHQRHLDRNEAAYLHWLYHQCSASDLAAAFDVVAGTARRWISEWKANPDAF